MRNILKKRKKRTSRGWNALNCFQRPLADLKDLCCRGNTCIHKLLISFLPVENQKKKKKHPFTGPCDFKSLQRRSAPANGLLSALTQVPLQSGRGGLAGAPYRNEAAPVTLQARVHLQLVAALFKSGMKLK